MLSEEFPVAAPDLKLIRRECRKEFFQPGGNILGECIQDELRFRVRCYIIVTDGMLRRRSLRIDDYLSAQRPRTFQRE